MKRPIKPIMSDQELSLAGEKEIAAVERDVACTEQGVVFRCAANYTVAWSRMRNKADIISWIYHLSEKSWFTPHRLNRFLELVAEKKKLDLHCAP